MKLRVRFGHRPGARTLQVDRVEEGNTVQELKEELREKGAAPAEGHFDLSLNKKDKLGESDLVKDSGIRPGDLVYVLADCIAEDGAKDDPPPESEMASVDGEAKCLPSGGGGVKSEFERWVDDALASHCFELRSCDRGEQTVSRMFFAFRNQTKAKAVPRVEVVSEVASEVYLTELGDFGILFATAAGSKDSSVHQISLPKDIFTRLQVQGSEGGASVRRQSTFEIRFVDEIILPLILDCCEVGGFAKPVLLDTAGVEIKLRVFSFLEAKDLGKLCCVSKEMNAVASDEALWRSLNEKDFSSRAVSPAPPVSWKRTFVANLEATNKMKKLKVGQYSLSHRHGISHDPDGPRGHRFRSGFRTFRDELDSATDSDSEQGGGWSRLI